MNRLVGVLPGVSGDSRDQRSDVERFSSPLIGMVQQIPVQSLVMYEAITVQPSASKLLSICDWQGPDSKAWRTSAARPLEAERWHFRNDRVLL